MKLVLVIIFALSTLPAFASKEYVVGSEKVTFRKGPGNDFKILKMIEVDSPITVIEQDGEWTKVEDKEGDEGYILTRFLDKEVPYKYRYEWLKKKYEKTKNELASLKEQKDEVTLRLSSTKKELEESKESFSSTKNAFEELKSGSKEYLELKANHERAMAMLDSQQLRIKSLEDLQLQRYIYFFVAGAVVLVLGWLLGMFARRKKAYGNSIQL